MLLLTKDRFLSSGHIKYGNQGVISGIVSERDYICKIALLGRTSKETKVKEISTKVGNLLIARPTDSIENCMDMVLSRGIRHLPIVDDDNGACVGFLSVKDLLKEVIKQKESQLERLASFALGKF
jgi:signal-transduction protein with cAMP-binding, CBS, and nucleotidyltransferase domain